MPPIMIGALIFSSFAAGVGCTLWFLLAPFFERAMVWLSHILNKYKISMCLWILPACIYAYERLKFGT